MDFHVFIAILIMMSPDLLISVRELPDEITDNTTDVFTLGIY